MDWKWYNNGEKNKKVYDNPPEGYVEGYILTKNKMDRLKKLNKRYDRKIKAVENYYKEKLKRVKEKLNKELKEQQLVIFPDLSN